MRLRSMLMRCALVLGALAGSGCERVLLAFANRGLPPPGATVVYAPGLSLDIYRPAGNGRAAPVVVFFHGGGWQRGTRQQYRFVGDRLARNGILAIVG